MSYGVTFKQLERRLGELIDLEDLSALKEVASYLSLPSSGSVSYTPTGDGTRLEHHLLGISAGLGSIVVNVNRGDLFHIDEDDGKNTGFRNDLVTNNLTIEIEGNKLWHVTPTGTLERNGDNRADVLSNRVLSPGDAAVRVQTAQTSLDYDERILELVRGDGQVYFSFGGSSADIENHHTSATGRFLGFNQWVSPSDSSKIAQWVGNTFTVANEDVNLATSANVRMRVGDSGTYVNRILQVGSPNATSILIGAGADGNRQIPGDNITSDELTVRLLADGNSVRSFSGSVLRIEKDIINAASDTSPFLEVVDVQAGTTPLLVDFNGNTIFDGGYRVASGQISRDGDNLFRLRSNRVLGTDIAAFELRTADTNPTAPKQILALVRSDGTTVMSFAQSSLKSHIAPALIEGFNQWNNPFASGSSVKFNGNRFDVSSATNFFVLGSDSNLSINGRIRARFGNNGSFISRNLQVGSPNSITMLIGAGADGNRRIPSANINTDELTVRLLADGNSVRNFSGTVLRVEKDIINANIDNASFFEVIDVQAGRTMMLIDAAENTFVQQVRFKEVTPPQITSDQDDYDPGRGTFFRLSSDATRTITGLALSGGNEDRSIRVVNTGSFDIVLANESASSAAANRIITGTGGDFTLGPDGTSDIHYDSTTGRWRAFT